MQPVEAWCPAPKRYRRGYYTMFLDHILQADQGCDFDFLVGQADDVVAAVDDPADVAGDVGQGGPCDSGGGRHAGVS